MKVILIETVEHAGTVGEIIDVKPGFARNYLFPRGMAILATPGSIASIKSKLETLAAESDLAKIAEIEGGPALVSRGLVAKPVWEPRPRGDLHAKSPGGPGSHRIVPPIKWR